MPGIKRRCAVACRAVAVTPRIDDDQLASSEALRVEVLHDRRHRLGDVRADEHDRVRAGEIRDWKRQAAVETERPKACGRCRRHAEAAVVVDVRSAQNDARELAQLIDLLVGERAAAEDADRVATVLALQQPQTGRDLVDGVLPAGWHQLTGGISHERRDEAIWMRQRVAGGEAFEAERAGVDGKLRVASDRQRADPARGERAAHIGMRNTDSACAPRRLSRGGGVIVSERS